MGLLRVNSLNLINTIQKRLVRPVYAHTQGYPYAGVLDPSLFNADGSIRIPTATDTLPLPRSAAAFTLQNSLVPGTVMVKTAGEAFAVGTGQDVATIRPIGLLGQFIGGTFDDLHGNTEIGIWRGPDSVYDLLAPAYDDTNLATLAASATAGNPVLLYTGTDGRLSANAAHTAQPPVAFLVDRPSNTRIRVNLLV